MATPTRRQRQAAATGVIGLTIAGVAVKLTAGDAREWLQVVSDFAIPIAMMVLLGGVLFFMHQQLQAHAACRADLEKLRRVLYQLVRASVRDGDEIVTEESFARGDFDEHQLLEAMARREPRPRPRRERRNVESADGDD